MIAGYSLSKLASRSLPWSHRRQSWARCFSDHSASSTTNIGMALRLAMRATNVSTIEVVTNRRVESKPDRSSWRSPAARTDPPRRVRRRDS